MGEFRSLSCQVIKAFAQRQSRQEETAMSVCVCVCVCLYVIPESILFYHYVNLALKPGQEWKGSKINK